jgi:hypothetical protein
MVINAAVQIKAPIAVAWRVFSNLNEWKDRNTACASCRFISGDRLVEEFWLRLDMSLKIE